MEEKRENTVLDLLMLLHNTKLEAPIKVRLNDKLYDISAVSKKNMMVFIDAEEIKK
ncbi:MAG: hypothetical protein K0R54_716 [Clostridiaceae bacterium]|jgi:hypothetical protein|nr:hypothetical protein [Clostridiaceae bacterium]